MQMMLMLVMAVLICTIGIMLQRLFEGPTIYDRMNGLGVITVDTILLIVIFGYLDKRPEMYVDIAIAYAMLGCLGSIILAKLLGGKNL